MLDLFLVPLAAALLVGAATTPIADVFVDASAANCATGTGSAANPVCSITAAIAIAAPGDTVRIAPGTYVENVVIGIDLELVGTGGAAVTIVDPHGFVLGISSDYPRIKVFEPKTAAAALNNWAEIHYSGN